MKIVNMKRFIKSIVLMFLFLGVISFIFINKSYSYNETTYKKIYVSTGDTLWTIAKNERNNNEYFYNKDIRDVVLELKNINKLKDSNLKVGQELNIPTI